ncbi:hypothetical protein [Peterkaempfera sp. SMS 1(5)a]|uniref:hypothetical protein n=1 Tax=Peterkaempfera podocarpi TaxID=3232308 RepID=UPI00366E4F32
MLRAAPFAAVCTLLAAAGHTVASGGTVPVAALAAGFILVWALGALLGGRERSLAAISGGLAAGQLMLHFLFHGMQSLSVGGQAGMPGMATGTRSAPQTVTEVAGRLLCSEHRLGGVLMLPSGTTPSQLVSRAGLDPAAYAPAPSAPWWHALLPTMSPLMLAGHLAAAVAAGWWLRRGEAALWRLVRLAASAVQTYAAPLRIVLAVARMLLRGLLGVSVVRPLRASWADRGGWRLPVPSALRHSVVRRGPPAAVYAI